MTDLKAYVRDIQDFPIPGIVFRDITTVLSDAHALEQAVVQLTELVADIQFDAILGPESRGFIFGMPLAYNLKKSFVPVRKKGKLPAKTVSKEYALEYGTAEIEIHEDAIVPGKRFLLVDDLLATGGTAKAACDLVAEMGGTVVANLFFIELSSLGGRAALQGLDARSLLVY